MDEECLKNGGSILTVKYFEEDSFLPRFKIKCIMQFMDIWLQN